jgi:hypothetical protein
LTIQAKQVVYNVHVFMSEEKRISLNCGSLEWRSYFNSAYSRTSNATGVGKRTIARLISEYKSGPTLGFVKSVRLVNKLYLIYKELPMLKSFRHRSSVVFLELLKLFKTSFPLKEQYLTIGRSCNFVYLQLLSIYSRGRQPFLRLPPTNIAVFQSSIWVKNF